MIDLIFEWNDFSWGPTTTYVKFFKKIKELRPDLTINHIDSVAERLKAEALGKYTGPASCYGPFYMMIKNRYTGKYILVSYWDSIKDIFEAPNHTNFNIGCLQEIITSIGVVKSDIEFKRLEYLRYTPFGYVSMGPQCEVVIEELYKKNLPKTIPDKPRFRNFPNDPFRFHLMGDNRFDCIDRRQSMLYPDEYMAELNSHKINLSVNGHGEICHRDMEIMGLGNVLLRTKFVVDFHEPLIPDVHYVAVDFDNYKDHKTLADKLIAKYNDIKDMPDFLDYVGRNAREWYLRNGCTDGNANLLTKIVDFKKLE